MIHQDPYPSKNITINVTKQKVDNPQIIRKYLRWILKICAATAMATCAANFDIGGTKNLLPDAQPWISMLKFGFNACVAIKKGTSTTPSTT